MAAKPGTKTMIMSKLWSKEERAALIKAEKSIEKPSDVYSLVMKMKPDLSVETVFALYMNIAAYPILYKVISIGDTTASVFSPIELLRPAIVHRAVRMVVLHNHLSGMFKPSQEDLKVTANLKRSCQDMAIDLVDHIIFDSENFMSFVANDLLPNVPERHTSTSLVLGTRSHR